MRNSLLFLSLVCILSCSTKHNEKKAVGEESILLNQTWNFLASNTISEQEAINDEHADWDKIEVPGNWDTENKYADYVGKGYYQRNLTIPKSWKGKQIRIKFDAVYETSKVWLNGKLLGTHKGGYTPFEYNITDQIKFEEINSVVVMADNTFKRGAWWAWGGISRDVSIVKNETARVVWQHISAIPDFDSGIVNFTIKYKIENNGTKTTDLALNSTLLNAKQEVWISKEHTTSVEAGQIIHSEISFETELSDVTLWHFDHPNLYKLNTELLTDNEVKQTIADNFGIRKLEVKGEQLLLNNEPIRVNGFNRVHDHRAYGNTEPEALIKKDILDIKALGGVFSRIMHAPASESLLKFCDSIGYMIVEEIPVWGRGAPNAKTDNPLTKQWLTEMIERDYNHPSVVGWSVGNEIGNLNCEWEEMTMTPDQYGYINSMLDHVMTLDRTRLKTYSSFTTYLPLSTLENEPVAKADFISINTYGKAFEKVVLTHDKFPGKPIFFSEIGDSQIGSGADASLSPKLLDELESLKELPYVIGTSLWTYNDYRSNYKNTPPSENRAWGVVDAWRNKKDAYYQIQQVYSPVKSLTLSIQKGIFVLHLLPRELIDIPSFSMRDYQLKCTFLGKDKVVLGFESIPLPEISPGDTGLDFKFENKDDCHSFEVVLISPNGVPMISSSYDLKKPARVDEPDQSEHPAILSLTRMDKSVVIGYTVSEKDSIFHFKYGENSKQLSQELSTKLKGSVKIPWDADKTFSVKVKSDNSNWSEEMNLTN